MITLPHECRCSVPRVSPKNWKTSRASVKNNNWFIHYRFYDSNGTVKPVMIQGMNRFSEWEKRVEITIGIMEHALEKLKMGYNPITKETRQDVQFDYEISPKTGFIEALKEGAKKLTCAKHTKDSIDSNIKILEPIARELNMIDIQIGDIKRRHVKRLLEHCQKKNELSACSFNHYRAHLKMIFKKLASFEAIETNPVDDEFEKQKEIRKIRKTLTKEEQAEIDKHLKIVHLAFNRYLHIFYHSGSRSSELLRLQGKDVNLVSQYFKKTILKGSQAKEVHGIIRDVALPYWQEVMENCKDEDYVFSRGLKPGRKAILYERITKLWAKHVKAPKDNGGLGITADFYSNKHTATDEIAQLLSIEHAMLHDSHTSTRTTLNYAQGHKSREEEQIKKLNTKFGS